MNLQNFKNDTTHLIIQFVDQKDGRLVENVPRSWVKNVNNKWYCFYPDKKNHRFIEKWCEQSKIPDIEKWKKYEIEILKEARKFKYLKLSLYYL